MGQPAFLRHDLMFNIGLSTINNNAHISNLGLKMCPSCIDLILLFQICQYISWKLRKLGWVDGHSVWKPSNTLRQRLVRPKDKTPRHYLSNMVKQWGLPWSSYWWEQNIFSTSVRPKHRGASTKGQDQYICICRGKDTSLRTLIYISWTGRDRWFERCAKEAISSQWRTLIKERRRSPSPPFSHLPGGLSQDG